MILITPVTILRRYLGKRVTLVISTRKIRREFDDDICRRCINREFRAHLKPQDCNYSGSGICACCGVKRNIVESFKLSGKVKMLMK